mmetsp:Transcript_25545/g.73480  ORF Transcript_25545/g.73480 Transcript_25545/m.73480 type:complete len:445 (+) Transcript_25545:1971-3305(+)
MRCRRHAGVKEALLLQPDLADVRLWQTLCDDHADLDPTLANVILDTWAIEVAHLHNLEALVDVTDCEQDVDRVLKHEPDASQVQHVRKPPLARRRPVADKRLPLRRIPRLHARIVGEQCAPRMAGPLELPRPPLLPATRRGAEHIHQYGLCALRRREQCVKVFVQLSDWVWLDHLGVAFEVLHEVSASVEALGPHLPQGAGTPRLAVACPLRPPVGLEHLFHVHSATAEHHRRHFLGVHAAPQGNDRVDGRQHDIAELGVDNVTYRLARRGRRAVEGDLHGGPAPALHLLFRLLGAPPEVEALRLLRRSDPGVHGSCCSRRLLSPSLCLLSEFLLLLRLPLLHVLRPRPQLDGMLLVQAVDALLVDFSLGAVLAQSLLRICLRGHSGRLFLLELFLAIIIQALHHLLLLRSRGGATGPPALAEREALDFLALNLGLQLLLLLGD